LINKELGTSVNLDLSLNNEQFLLERDIEKGEPIVHIPE
jgi:hypothetical protein